MATESNEKLDSEVSRSVLLLFSVFHFHVNATHWSYGCSGKRETKNETGKLDNIFGTRNDVSICTDNLGEWLFIPMIASTMKAQVCKALAKANAI